MKMPKKPKTIVQDHKQNFETLKRAFAEGQVALMDCILLETGEHVAVICAVGWQSDLNVKGGGEYTFTPFAMFFNGNPFELLLPPTDKSYDGIVNKELSDGRE
jgi:hypothetical protein